MITFKTLTWDNMFSYGSSNSIELNKEKISQIVGLNGHGKSSIPLILEECLFNKNAKGTKRDRVLNRLSDKKKYSCSLKFSANDDEYEIYLERASTQKVKLFKNGEDISSHTATNTFKEIEEIIGFDYKLFSSVAYQHGSNGLAFLTETDTNRKKFLIGLLFLDQYVETHDKLKAAYLTLDSKLSELKGSMANLVATCQRNTQLSLQTRLELRPEAEIDSTIESKVAELNSNLENIVRLNKQISNNNQYKARRDAFKQEDLRKELPQLPISNLEYRNKLNKQGELKSSTDRIKKELTHYSKLSPTCPSCKQAIDISSALAKKAELEKELKELEASLASLQKEVIEFTSIEEQHKKQQALINEYEKYAALVDESIQDSLLDKEALELQITQLKKELKRQKDSLTQVREHNTKAIQHNAKIDFALEQLAVSSKELSDVENRLSVLNSQLEDLNTLKNVFGTNGLIAHKISHSVRDLEKLTNRYLQSLSNGRFQLLFKLEGDKLNVVVSDEGDDVDISDLSQGERARVTTATLLAIRKMMAALAKNKINVLFLDETIDSLDAEGREQLVQILLEEENLNIFLISHGYTHPLLHKISVIKENGISRLEE